MPGAKEVVVGHCDGCSWKLRRQFVIEQLRERVDEDQLPLAIVVLRRYAIDCFSIWRSAVVKLKK